MPQSEPAVAHRESGMVAADAGRSVTEKSGRAAAAAAVAVAGKSAVERYGPVAEDQARRALRGAGRSVGRVLRRASPPAEPPR